MAEAARTDAEKADLLEVERRWLKLARNQGAKTEGVSRKADREGARCATAPAVPGLRSGPPRAYPRDCSRKWRMLVPWRAILTRHRCHCRRGSCRC